MISSDEEEEEDNMFAMLLLCSERRLMRPLPTPKHTSILTGALYFSELMATANVPRFRNSARMSRETFEQLVRRCKAQGGLKDTRKISAGEKVMIFLYILSGQSNRSTQERCNIAETLSPMS